MTEQLTITPIEGINEFYRLKDKYESSYYEKYVKPIVNSRKSKREKRVDYSKLPKHECINCKRNVGTIFNISIDNKTQTRIFSAKCGDLKDPCPLDIKITYAMRNTFDNIINKDMTSLEKIKLNIIKEKNNALFFNKDVVSVFENFTEELKLETENLGFLIETNLLRNDNPEKHNLLKLENDEFGKGFIIPFKQMVQEYLETNNELILNQAVTFYINEMIPKLKEIQKLRYDVSFVEFNTDIDIYNLIQIPNSLENREFFWKGDDKLEKFTRGVKQEKKKTRKASIETAKQPKINKTKKIKPIKEFVIEEDEEPVVNEVEPIVNEVEPVVNEVEPVVNEVEPIVNEVEPVVNEVEPAMNEESEVNEVVLDNKFAEKAETT